MRSRIAFALVVCFSPLFIYMSCKDSTTSPGKGCNGVICTMEFRGITLQVNDNEGNPVKLDEAYTIRVKTGEQITHDANSTTIGSYTVLDDGYQKKLAQSTAEFRFVGKRGGQEVVNELYTISADCCHISKQSGKTDVTLP
ncbi:hypothetical protein [Polluticoccus soli]|uniref:hypothetical protein n=1 Tax=Polluticoccus soli TaxID=3034150 RepID=UPI0023E2BDBB|nr:hypothetical protein [Flavipsychrobacter sp. JY13-12]